MRKGNEKDALQRNTVLNNTYQVRRVIARSELTIVYAGRDRSTGAKVVVKEFFPRRLAGRKPDHKSAYCASRGYGGQYRELLAAFMMEGELLSALDHPHIVRHVDHFEANDTGYVIMEYCDGVPMNDYLKEHNHRLDADFIYTTLLPLVDTIEYVHKQGILHRDIKPTNIMVLEDGTPKLIDFGSAVRCPVDAGEKQTIFTSAGYSPLEFYSEKSVQGPISDLYSLAALLYYWTCGQPPTDVKQRLFRDELLAVRAYNEYVTRWLSSVIRWGLTVRSEKRCSSLSWIKRALQLQAMVWKVRKPGNVEWAESDQEHTQVYEARSGSKHETA